MGNVAGVPPEDRRTLVILGAGPVGTEVLRQLMRQKMQSRVQVIVVEPKDAYHHSIGALRAFVDPTQAERVCMPYGPLFEEFGPTLKQLRGWATSVTGTSVTVELIGGGSEVLQFDYLVLAMGAKTAFPGYWGADTVNAADAIAKYQSAQESVAAAQSICIIGGGAVGVELAGELAMGYAGSNPKRITLVHSGPTLLHKENLKPDMVGAVLQKLKDAGVTVLTNRTAVVQPDSDCKETCDSMMKPFVKAPVSVMLDDGTHLDADIAFACTGPLPNTSCLKEELAGKVDAHGRVKVNSFMLVDGCLNIFAGGDVCGTQEQKTARVAWMHGEVIGKNIVAAMMKKSMTEHHLASRCMGIPVGPNDGVAQFPSGMVVGKRIITWFKSRDLFVGKVRKDMHIE